MTKEKLKYTGSLAQLVKTKTFMGKVKENDIIEVTKEDSGRLQGKLVNNKKAFVLYKEPKKQEEKTE